MTDRELLEWAAKAAGVEHVTPMMVEWGKWDPLTDDGDALRLAVDLRIGIEFGNDEVATDWPVSERYTTRPDGASSIDERCAATRRAIVRAAAAIARRVEEEI